MIHALTDRQDIRVDEVDGGYYVYCAHKNGAPNGIKHFAASLETANAKVEWLKEQYIMERANA